MEIGFCLGSNLGDRVDALSRARAAVLAFSGTTLVAASSLYETSPVDVQPEFKDLKFLNAVLIVDSNADGETWLKRIAEIEAELGRERGFDRNAPRTVDVDILYIGDQMIESRNLTIPHPSWAKRRFVLQPLADVRPDTILPGVGQTVQSLLDDLQSNETVHQLEEAW